MSMQRLHLQTLRDAIEAVFQKRASVVQRGLLIRGRRLDAMTVGELVHWATVCDAQLQQPIVDGPHDLVTRGEAA